MATLEKVGANFVLTLTLQECKGLSALASAGLGNMEGEEDWARSYIGTKATQAAARRACAALFKYHRPHEVPVKS